MDYDVAFGLEKKKKRKLKEVSDYTVKHWGFVFLA